MWWICKNKGTYVKRVCVVLRLNGHQCTNKIPKDPRVIKMQGISSIPEPNRLVTERTCFTSHSQVVCKICKYFFSTYVI